MKKQVKLTIRALVRKPGSYMMPEKRGGALMNQNSMKSLLVGASLSSGPPLMNMTRY